MSNLVLKLVLVFFFSFLVSCAENSSEVSRQIVNSIEQDPSCSESVDLVWKSLYVLDESGTSLSGDLSLLKEALTHELENRFEVSLDYKNSFVEKYAAFYSKIALIQARSKRSNWVKRLGLIEYESLSSGLSELKLSEIKLLALEAANELDTVRPACKPKVQQKGRFIKGLKNSHHPVVYGAKKVFLTAYQDCRLDKKKALSLKSHAVEGIIDIEGGHPDGLGGKRRIADKDLLYNTHHYYGYRPLTGQELGESFKAGACLDQKKHLMIYDYGGKPKTFIREDSSLNLFENAVAEASEDLGIDCSGFVFSALASAGLRLHPDRKMLAKHVYFIGANNFRTPDSKSNSIVYMPCLQKVYMDRVSNLKAGDIVSDTTHTFIVGDVGADPLGINKGFKKNRCSKITYKDFNFNIYHSDPGKGAIGIHHVDSRSLFSYNLGMRRGLEALARKICTNSKNKSNAKTLSRLYKDFKISIVRHKNTPECKGSEVSLTAESCLNECN